MSPVTIDKIKKSNGQVRINSKVLSESKSQLFEIQILEGGSWVSIYSSPDRNVCEQAIRSANSKLILG